LNLTVIIQEDPPYNQTHPLPLPTKGGEKQRRVNEGNPNGRRAVIPDGQERAPIAHQKEITPLPKKELQLHIRRKSFGGRNAAAPTNSKGSKTG
jgi:hypothetical protein